MTLIPFAEWRPDVSDYQSQYTKTAQNVLPQADGWGPFPDFAALSQSLPAPCRGAFRALKNDGSVVIFAGTATKLYTLNNTTFAWIDASLGGGSYTTLANTDNWHFAQFGNLVYATQKNAVLQNYDMTSSTAFANAPGSPPQAAYIAVVNRFLVLTGLLSFPYRIVWSGLNDVNSANSWTQGLNSSDLQDLPDGGICRGVAGGEFGLILQDTVIRRMTFAPGSSYVFLIERAAEDIGLYAPESLVHTAGRVFFLAPSGFQGMQATGVPTPIGRERVDRTFLADVDRNNLQLCIGAGDPRSNRVLWAYKSNAGAPGLFDKMIGYDWAIDRWFTIKMTGEYITSLSVPAATLESLDAIAPGVISVTGAANNGSGLIRLAVTSTSTLTTGQIVAVGQANPIVGTTEANGNWTITVIDATHIDLQGSAFVHAYVSGGSIGGSLDAMTISLDAFATSNLPQIAAFNGSHQAGFFTGANLEATIDTGEQTLHPRRMFVRGFTAITDASTVVGSASARETQNTQTGPAYSAEASADSKGLIPLRVDTRYSRGRVRIPAASTWSYARGIDPDVVPMGGK